ncbi:MAG: metallophosphoesterase [Chloroflexota bacterium]
MNADLWLRLAPAALGVLVGKALFLVLVNRVLGHLSSRTSKLLLAGGGLGGLALGLGGLGYGLGHPVGTGLMLALLGLLLLGEAGLWWSARRERGAPAVETHRLSEPPGRPWLLHPLTTTDLHLRRYELQLALPAAAPRLRVAHLSDFHVSERLPAAHYRRAIEAAAAAQPDLVFLTGDFVSHAEDIQRLPQLLHGLSGRLGMYAVLGNHDHWAGAQAIRDRLRDCGVEVLGNGQRRLAFDGLPALHLYGCEEPWGVDGRARLEPVAPGELGLVLSHTADYAGRYRGLGAAAVFSGHYHAGQVCLPFWGPVIIPSRYGRRFAHGHYCLGQTHLFVSAGVGTGEPPRIYCSPDLFIVDLLFQPGAAVTR